LGATLLAVNLAMIWRLGALRRDACWWAHDLFLAVAAAVPGPIAELWAGTPCLATRSGLMGTWIRSSSAIHGDTPCLCWKSPSAGDRGPASGSAPHEPANQHLAACFTPRVARVHSRTRLIDAPRPSLEVTVEGCVPAAASTL